MDLFRRQAVEKATSGHLGSISLATPIRYRRWALCLGALTIALVSVLAIGHYSRRHHVTGRLIYREGQSDLISPKAGTISELLFSQGDHVKKGDVVAKIFAGQFASTGENVSGASVDSISKQINALNEASIAERSVAAAEARQSKLKMASLVDRLSKVGERTKIAKERFEASQVLLVRIQPLVKSGVVSAVQLEQQKVASASSQRDFISSQEDGLALREQVDATAQQLQTAADRLSLRLGEIQSKVQELQAQRSRAEAEREIGIRSPLAGELGTLNLHVGETVVEGQAIATVSPSPHHLQARLLVKSDVVGLAKVGSSVVLHVEAFPFQRFGGLAGRIASISRTALSANQASALLGDGSPKEQMYVVMVELPRDTMQVNGASVDLTAGMDVEGSILLDRRSVLQWLLNPVEDAREKFSN